MTPPLTYITYLKQFYVELVGHIHEFKDILMRNLPVVQDDLINLLTA